MSKSSTKHTTMYMKNGKKESRVINQASHTALMAAIHRHLATLEDRQYFKGPDNMAYLFLPAKVRFFLSFAFVRRVLLKRLHQKVPGSYEYVTARTRFIDEIFSQSINEEVPQIVILGAGDDLQITTVKTHVRNILLKLEVKNRSEAVVKARENQII